MDAMRKLSAKDWNIAKGGGDGWNCKGYGHTKRQRQGRKKLTRKARHAAKANIKNWQAAY